MQPQMSESTFPDHKVLYIYFKGRPGEDVSIITRARYQRTDDGFFLIGEWPQSDQISGAFAGKAISIRVDAIESVIEFDSEEEVLDKVYSRSTTRTSRWGLPDAMYFVGLAIVFGNYIGKVPADIGWIGWALAMVGWYWTQRR